MLSEKDFRLVMVWEGMVCDVMGWDGVVCDESVWNGMQNRTALLDHNIKHGNETGNQATSESQSKIEVSETSNRLSLEKESIIF
jgi:hypothetical protein